MKTGVLLIVFTLYGSLAAVDPAAAQGAAPATAAAQPAAPARSTQGAGAGAAPKNIRFDIAIADSGTTRPISKVVTLNVSQGGTGSIRTTAAVPGVPASLPKTVTTRAADGKTESTTTQSTAATIALNVDVSNPVIYEDGGIRALVVIEYQPYVASSAGTGSEAAVVRANSMSVFTSGQKMVLLQAADPLSDRRTVIEVTATVVK